MRPAVAPGAPEDLRIKALHELFRLFWDTPDRTGERPNTRYLVQWKSGSRGYNTMTRIEI